MGEKETLLEGGRRLAASGLTVETWGNLSLRDEEGRVYITPSGMDYLSCTPEDIVVVDMEGRVLEGARRRDLESNLGVTFLDTPGHTADSMSLLTEDGSLFCGDAAMAGPLSSNYAANWMEDVEEYRASWETMLDSGARMVYPGHGGAFPLGLLGRAYPKLKRVHLRKP